MDVGKTVEEEETDASIYLTALQDTVVCQELLLDRTVELLKQDPDSIDALAETHRKELFEYARKLQKTPKEDVYASELPETVNQKYRPPKSLVELFYNMFYNRYDEEIANEWRQRGGEVTPEKRQEHQARRMKQATVLVEVLARHRNQHAMPPGIMQDSIERLYQGTRESDWLSQTRQKKVLAPNTTRKLVRTLSSQFKLRVDFDVSKHLAVHCRDNLEFWLKVKFAGYEADKKTKKESELLHTVTGEDFPVDSALVDPAKDDEELAGATWPFLNTFNMHNSVPSATLVKKEMQDMVTEAWTIMAPKDGIDDGLTALLMRPPPAADVQRRSPTPHKHAQILMDVGTSSYDDAKKIVRGARQDQEATYHVIYCDLGLMPRIMGLRHLWPHEFSDVLPVPGEFHAHAHAIDGVFRLEWWYNIEWMGCFFEVKSLKQKLIMKDYSLRYHWLTLLLSAAFRWLRDLGFSTADISDVEGLLAKVEKNLPVYAFLGFVFYELVFLWKWKTAIQVHDVGALNYAWKFCTLLYADTEKKNYKKGVMQMNKILFDTVHSVQVAVSEMRTMTETGRPCSNQAMDMANEKAGSPFPCLNSLHLLIISLVDKRQDQTWSPEGDQGEHQEVLRWLQRLQKEPQRSHGTLRGQEPPQGIRVQARC